MTNKNNEPLRAVSTERANDLEWIINNAATSNEAVIIDADSGIVESRATGLISPHENVTGLVNYKTHYRAA